jgi:hypothetical protein
MKSLILLRRGTPKQEGIEIEGDVFIEKGDGEVGLRLREEDVVVVGQAWADDGHGKGSN